MKDYFIVGDVHGCFYTLELLLKNWTPGQQQLIFVGDIIDHGNHSPQVAALIKKIAKENTDTIVLRGNHEQLFINHCLNQFNQDWYEKSGERTFGQYLAMGRNIDEDAKWFATFPVYFREENIFISHAGMPKTENPFDPNNPDGVVWHRDEIQDLPQIQAYGHTPKEEAVFDAATNAINIDTGAYKCNKLTSIVIDKAGKIKDLISIDTHDKDLPVEEEACIL
ncbi:serine/threonine protein phosphatase [Pedobacter sp. SD-b]|uniref:Serine/threonine protein phosphatase n=1 Tax=Pedobacter segetis TaxID=2793069 RepID=A0ABS1BMU0_9SPHI|nr:metallophosphoesterase [Pedobacter segetis]MBK0384214.1 serine/threonine protein phosphatase [Pedobacter segetis]